tara:strand:+ start:212 stop:487 length:276 start_codon:yes stop_codon:yes gene_type:complete
MSIRVVIYTASWCKKCKEDEFINFLKNVRESSGPDVTFEEIKDENDFPENIISVPSIEVFEKDSLKYTYAGVSEITDCLEMELFNLTTHKP